MPGFLKNVPCEAPAPTTTGMNLVRLPPSESESPPLAVAPGAGLSCPKPLLKCWEDGGGRAGVAVAAGFGTGLKYLNMMEGLFVAPRGFFYSSVVGWYYLPWVGCCAC